MEEHDSAMALPIILVLLFQQEMNSIIHVPGKFVPTMISFLSKNMPRKEHEKLVQCQHLITAKWKTKSSDDKTSSQAASSTVQLQDKDSDLDDSTSEDDAIDALIQDLKQLVIRANA